MVATQQPPPSAPERKSSKRTRVLNTQQSKNGCYTCKQRRIKCDERKPTCLRCSRSERVCAGYPPGVSTTTDSRSSSTSSSSTPNANDSPHTVHLSPDQSFNLVPWSSLEQRRFCDLASNVLASDPHHIHGPSNAAVFCYLLPQLNLAVPCVNAASAAFGAAYESVALYQDSVAAANISAKHYVHALQLMQNELKKPSHGHVPPLIASVLLAAAETIQHRQKDALAHVLGAFSLFNIQEGERSAEERQSSSLAKVGSLDVLEEVFISMDLQIATFAWGKQPYLKTQRLSPSILTATRVEDLIDAAPTLIHKCLHFAAAASKECYRHYGDLPFSLVQQQGQLISYLRIWLSSFRQIVQVDAAASTKRRCTPADERHLHLLKSQVLAILITISNIKTSTQTTYDTYEREFEEIIRCAESVLGHSSSCPASTEPTQPPSKPKLPPFSPSPGIIQPLSFLARKCRHSLYRRRAILLLRASGIEGPFSGDLEGAVAERIVEIEEDRPFKVQLGDDEVLTSAEIPDHRRIGSCWRLTVDEENRHKKSVKLCRRKYPSPHQHGLGASEHMCHDDDDDDDDDRGMGVDMAAHIEWDMWEEHFAFDIGGVGGPGTEPSSVKMKQWRPLPHESFLGKETLDSMGCGMLPVDLGTGLAGPPLDASQSWPDFQMV